MKAPPEATFGRLPPGGAAGGPAKPVPLRPLGFEAVGVRELSRLKWRCRRGLLENDLFIERFFKSHEATLTQAQAEGLSALMDLADNDLLDLLLARKEPADLPAQAHQDAPQVLAPNTVAVLALMRRNPHPLWAAKAEPALQVA